MVPCWPLALTSAQQPCPLPGSSFHRIPTLVSLPEEEAGKGAHVGVVVAGAGGAGCAWLHHIHVVNKRLHSDGGGYHVQSPSPIRLGGGGLGVGFVRP